MNIDQMTIGEAKQIAAIICGHGVSNEPEETFFEPGKKYFIRTVTHHYIGELVRLNRGGDELILTNAAWIADDGRFHDALKTGDFDEVEPYLDEQHVLVNRIAILDAVEWDKEIPRSQK